MPATPLIILFLIFFGIATSFIWPRYRLFRAVKKPFPQGWRNTLKRNMPVYRRMPTDLQLQLKQRIKQFIHEKTFIGCAGFEIDDEVRVTIAASACLLLLNRDTDVYAGLRYVLVYPDAFLVEREITDANGLRSVKQTGVVGESWSNGKVILSWQDVLKGSSKFDNGSNVALHEFAHQLDHESGATNGSPDLGPAARYRRWAAVFTDEYKRLQQSAFKGDKTLINHYGATEPAEFFAVVTETFFEQPTQMAERHPALFSELKNYYRVDPRDWLH